MIAVAVAIIPYYLGFSLAICGMLLTFYLYGVLGRLSTLIAQRVAKTKESFRKILFFWSFVLFFLLNGINIIIGAIFSEVFLILITDVTDYFITFIIGFGIGFAYDTIIDKVLLIKIEIDHPKGLACKEKGCDGSVDLNSPVSLRVGCESFATAYFCNKCGRLHWYNDEKIEGVKNRQNKKAFLIENNIIHK